MGERVTVTTAASAGAASSVATITVSGPHSEARTIVVRNQTVWEATPAAPRRTPAVRVRETVTMTATASGAWSVGPTTVSGTPSPGLMIAVNCHRSTENYGDKLLINKTKSGLKQILSI